MQRDLNHLNREMGIGASRQYVIQTLGQPTTVAHSLADLDGEAFPLGPPKGEELLLFPDYPWGIVVYIDKKKQAVSRVMLVMHY